MQTGDAAFHNKMSPAAPSALRLLLSQEAISSRLTACVNGCFARAESKLVKPGFWALALCALGFVQSWLVLDHVHWFDEWQALLIAVQSPDLTALLANLRYEGHPPLWYLLLRTVAAVVTPLTLLSTVQLIIALSMQALILLRAPFGRTERLLIAGSYFILFEFGTIARSLSFGALMLILFFAIRNTTLRWAITVLMPMVDFQFGLLSAVMAIILFREGRWTLVGASLWIASGLFSAWTVIPAPDIQSNHLSAFPALLKFFDDVSVLLVPYQTQGGVIGWSGGLPMHLGLVAGPLFLWFSMKQASTVRLHGWLYGAFLAACCLFCLTVYSLSIRHLTLLALLLILLKWREALVYGTKPDTVFRFWLVMIALGGASVVGISASRPFDRGADVAAFIRKHHLENKNWVTWRPERGVVVGTLLGKEMAMLDGACTHSFIRWNFRDRILSPQTLNDAARHYADRYGRSYLITSLPPTSLSGHMLQPLASFPAGYNAYPYHIYVVGPNLPETSLRPPPCPPIRLPLH